MIEVKEKTVFSWDCPKCGAYNELENKHKDDAKIKCDFCDHTEKWKYKYKLDYKK